MIGPLDKKWSLALLCGVVVLSLLILNIPAQAKKKSVSEKGWLGVYIQDLDKGLIEALGLRTTEGVLVNDIAEDSPAETAGMETKDVIIKYDGKKVTKSDDLTAEVRKTKPGKKVEIEINRDGSKKKLQVVVGEAPEIYSLMYDGDWQFSPGDDFFYSFGDRGYLGVSLEGLTEQLGDYFGVKDGEGALVTEVVEDSPAQKAGIKAGDVIVKIDDEAIEDPGDVTDVIRDKEKGDKVKLEVMRDRRKESLTAEIEKTELASSYRHALKTAKIRMPRGSLPEPGIMRIEINKDELKKEMDKLKDEVKELKEELEKLKEKGI
jgi:serine protease Do